MSYYSKQKYLANLTPTDLTKLTAANHERWMRNESQHDKVTIPVKNADTHLVAWLFMVRHPWEAPPVRSAYGFPYPSNIVKTVFEFEVGIYATPTSGGLWEKPNSGYFAILWGIPSTKNSFNAGSQQGVVTAPATGTAANAAVRGRDVWYTKPGRQGGATTDYANLDTLLSATNAQYLPVLTSMGTVTTVGTTISNTSITTFANPFDFYANITNPNVTNDGSVDCNVRPLACGIELFPQSSPTQRQGEICFIEMPHHDQLVPATQVDPIFNQTGAGQSGGCRISSARFYPMAGSVGFKQNWHPIHPGDFDWFTPAYATYGPTSISAGTLSFPAFGAYGDNGQLNSYSSTNGTTNTVPYWQTNPCSTMLIVGRGLFQQPATTGPSEAIHCKMTYIYEYSDGNLPGTGVSITHPQAPMAAVRSHQNVSRGQDAHTGQAQTTAGVAKEAIS